MKVGDGKTAWKDLPYVGNGQTIELPENIMKFLGVVSELPESAEDNTVCLMDNIVYIYSNNSWQVFHNNGSIGVIKIIGDDSRTDGFEVNGVKYDNFSDALNNAPAGSTIILQQNIDTLPITAGKNVAIDLNNIKIATDLQILQKILPKIYGNFETLWIPLTKILLVCLEESKDKYNSTNIAYDSYKVSRDTILKNLNSSKYPRTVKKIIFMLDNLANKGFTSYFS